MPSIGSPEVRISSGIRGLSASTTDAGLPDRITPFGAIRANAAAADWNGAISL